MKDILKLFETIMDFKGLSFLVTKQSLMKNSVRFFFLAIVSTDKFYSKLFNQIIRGMRRGKNYPIYFMPRILQYV